MDALRTPDLEESAAFVLEFEGARCRRITLHPTAADAAGEQRPAEDPQASRILERMHSMCAALGTAMANSDNTGIIDVFEGVRQ
jgi:hypothetical protein